MFQCFTSAELGNAGGLDLDFRTGARVAPGARRALSNLERAEPYQRYARAFLESTFDRIQRAIERLLGGGLGNIGRFCD